MTAEREAPQPGTDEIIVTAPEPRTVCHSREHTRLGVLAEVVVTFGQMGTGWTRDALWQDSWGRSYAMCGECRDVTLQVAKSARPGLTITVFPERPAARNGPQTAT